MAGVSLRNISKSFGKVDVIKNLSLDIHDHEFTVFVGPSGCGKSTLLRLIAGLEDANDGEIFIGGDDVTFQAPAKRGVAMVFQSYALYPHMTVYQNIAFGIRSLNNKKQIDIAVQEAADVLKISHLLDRKPKQLSGGQRQRVAIGRAIVRHPEVFLFDEPLSNLDASLRVEMRFQIARIKSELNKTMIYVTHDQVEAMTLADKIVVLQNGTIEQCGSPLELYHAPKNRFVAGFLGSPRMNFIEVTIKDLSEKQASIQLEREKDISLSVQIPDDLDHLRSGSKATLGIRPEHCVESNPEDALLSGTVRVVENLGSEIYAYLRLDPDVTILIRTRGDHPVRIGDTMHVTFDPKSCHLFDLESERALVPPSYAFEEAVIDPMRF